jgi:tagatose-6-phosphate ketose/aldose isomerase
LYYHSILYERDKYLANALSELLSVSAKEKEARGILYTPGEIAQQPATWETTYQHIVAKQKEICDFLRSAGIGVHGAAKPTVFLIGAGTSDYVGRALASLLQQRWQCEVMAIASTDLLGNIEGFVLPGRPYLWISFSRSGDSSEGIAVIETATARYPEIRHLVVSCNKDGRMARICKNANGRLAVVLDDAVNDRGLAMTSSFSNMIVAGHSLAHIWSLSEYEEIIADLITMGREFLPLAADMASKVAAEGCSKACFVGSGALSAVAKESALKLLELTAGKIHTISESTLGLRHGPMSALTDDTLFVSFLSADSVRRKYEMDLLREIKAKGLGRIRVAIAPEPIASLNALVDKAFLLNAPAGFGDDYRPPVDIILAQLLGLFSSIEAGLKPDCPSPNGAISRVVSHVNIYS